MWLELLLNLAVLVALSCLGSLMYSEEPQDLRRSRLLQVLIAAVSVTLLMLVATQPWPGVLLDLRLVPLALIAVTYGARWAALAALPGALLRFTLGGAGLLPEALAAVLVIALAALLGQRARTRPGWLLALLSFAPLPLALLLVPDARPQALTALLPLFALQVVGALSVQSVYGARTRLLRLARSFQKQARTDSLTGLWNRRQFNEDLALLSAGDHLMLLDIDHFKKVNDKLGHDVGDEVLMRVAEVLALTHAPGRVYRLGGEEFALLLRRSTPDQARVAAELCWRAVRTRSYHPTTRLHVTCSVGVAVLKAGEDSHGLYQRADEALYRAKSNGRDQVVYGLTQDTPLPPVRASQQANASLTSASRSEVVWHSRWKAVLSTLELVTNNHDLSAEDWERLVQAAVYSVPGAETGSLTVREGHDFVMRAQVGFPEALLGTRMTELGQRLWYAASYEDYLAGRPRVLRGSEATRVSQQADAADHIPAAVFMAAGRTGEIQSTLCVPVVVNGVVVAHLNLDNFSNPHAFQGPGVEVAREFGAQIGAVIRASEARRQAFDRQRELEALTRVTTTLRDAVTEQEVLLALVQECCALLHTDAVAYLTYDRATDALITGPHTGLNAAIDYPPAPRGVGLSWLALESGEVKTVADVSQDPRVRYHPSLRRDALLAAPLRTQRLEELGVLLVSRDLERPFKPQDEQLARGIASLAVTALERARHLQQLETSRNGAFQALGLALEVRDFETQGHTRRVVTLAERFAARLNLGALQREALVQGAYLHDIGKLQVPDRILLKPGALDSAEWRVMQMHAQWGFEIARRVPGIRPEALELILHHHERWEGGGYPRNLAGAEIPLLARAFSIIDTYDALTHARPYKPAWTAEGALAELRAQAGRQFDPELVPAFERVLRDVAAEGSLLEGPQVSGGRSLLDHLSGRGG